MTVKSSESKSTSKPSTPLVLNSKVMLGVDEAGRGPVLGPMVYAAAFAPIDSLQQLKDLGVDDSKVLKEEFRDSLFEELNNQDFIGWKAYVCSPKEISESMLRRYDLLYNFRSKYNLNALAHDITIQLIRDVISQGVQVDQIYIDTVGPPQQYQEMLEKLFPRIKIKVAKKADSLYPIVSAASIVAKVTRDSILRDWEFDEKLDKEFERDFGCGYPSDSKTVKWLQNNFHSVFGFPNLIRFSWSTAEKIMTDKGVSVKWAHEVDQEVDSKDIRGFFSNLNHTRDPIYSQLGLESVKSLNKFKN